MLDAVLVGVFLVVGFLTTSGTGQYEPGQVEPRDAWAVLLIFGIVLPYLFRRRAPLTVFVISGLLVVVYVTVPYNEGGLPTIVIIGAYSVGAWCSTRKGIFAMVFVAAALLAVVASDAPRFDWGDFVVNMLAYAAAFFFGTTVRARRLRTEALEQRAEALEHEQEEKQARLLADERLRIAHELHDVIAHSMGVIAVQAGVGAHVIDTDPMEAKRALSTISAVSRSTLGEIRRILAALREEDDSAATLAPAPTLADLDHLVDELRGAGLDVQLERSGECRVTVPQGVELAGFRIVQEALTNVLKHAGPAHADVRVGYEPGVLHLTVTDDGRGAASTNGSPQADRAGRHLPEDRAGRHGHGLIGMRERVAAYGGTFSAGPRVGGGFTVDATIPYEVES